MFECPLWRYGSAVACHRDRGSGHSRLGYGISPLGRDRHLPHHRAARTYTGLGNKLLEVKNRTLCAPKPRKKEQWPHKRLTQLTRECPGVSSRDAGWWWAAAGLGAVNVAVCAWNLLKEVAIIFITCTIVWPLVNSREGTQPHPSTENWMKDLLSMVPPLRRRPIFPLSQSFPSGSSVILLSCSIWGQIVWKTQSQKTNQFDHMDHSFILLMETMSHAM